jgi:hypothetical protein
MQFESRFEADFSGVRVHTEAGADKTAHDAGSRAFTIGDDIVFGPRAWAPETTGGRLLLAHELAHVVQQRRGGTPPWPTLRPALESDARQSAEAFAAGRQVSVARASTRAAALAAREPTLLRSDRDPATMSPDEIEAEVLAIHAWLLEHQGMDVEGKDRLEALLPRLEAISIRHREAAKSLSSASIEEQKPEAAAAAAPPAAAKLQAPPLPAGGVGENPLAAAMRIVGSFKASEVAGNAYTGVVNGRTITLTEAQFQQLRGKASDAVLRALHSVRSKAEGAAGRYAEQQKVDARHWIVAPIVKGLGGVKDPKPFLDAYVAAARGEAARAERALAGGDLNTAAAAAASAELSATKASKMVQAYVDQIIDAGEMTVTVLEYVKFASEVVFLVLATVATAGAGGAAATSVLGFEVGTGTAVTVIGTTSAIAEEVGVGIARAADGEQVDWGQIATHAAIQILMARFGGKVGARVGNAFVARFGAKAASLVTPLIMHEANTVFFSVVDAAVQALRGKPMTMQQLEDELVNRMLDPKGLALAIVQSRLEAKLAGEHAGPPAAGSHEATGEPPTPPARAKPAPTPPPPAGHDVPPPAKTPTPAVPPKPAAKAPAPPPPAAASAGEPQASLSLDQRIAAAEGRLNPARQRTLEYQEQRRAEGKSLKGGPIKVIWNTKEDIWLLKRQRAYPGRKILAQAHIVGVKSPGGNVVEAATVAGQGRTLDYVELRGSKVVGGELKSEAELKTSVRGGLKGSTEIAGEFRGKVAAQQRVERRLQAEASKQGGKLVIKGVNVMTEKEETIEVDPADYGSEVTTYAEQLPN